MRTQHTTKAAAGQGYFVSFYSASMKTELSTIDHEMFRVLMMLGAYINQKGMCWPGQRELARVTGMRVEAVGKALARLEAAGLIQYVRRNERDKLTGGKLPDVIAVDKMLVRLPHNDDNQNDDAPDDYLDLDPDHDPGFDPGLREENAQLETESVNRVCKEESKTEPESGTRSTTTRSETKATTTDKISAFKVESGADWAGGDEVVSAGKEKGAGGGDGSDEKIEDYVIGVCIEHGSTPKQIRGYMAQYGWQKFKAAIEYSAGKKRAREINNTIGYAVKLLREGWEPLSAEARRAYQYRQWGIES